MKLLNVVTQTKKTVFRENPECSLVPLDPTGQTPRWPPQGWVRGLSPPQQMRTATPHVFHSEFDSTAWSHWPLLDHNPEHKVSDPVKPTVHAWQREHHRQNPNSKSKLSCIVFAVLWTPVRGAGYVTLGRQMTRQAGGPKHLAAGREDAQPVRWEEARARLCGSTALKALFWAMYDSLTGQTTRKKGASTSQHQCSFRRVDEHSPPRAAADFSTSWWGGRPKRASVMLRLRLNPHSEASETRHLTSL